MKKYYETGESVICETCNLTDGTTEVQNFTDSYPDGVTCNDCGEASPTSDLPNIINAMRVISYNVGEVRNSLAELNGIPASEVKDYEITDLINTWISEDFSCGFGHTAEKLDIIIQDENGEDINW